MNNFFEVYKGNTKLNSLKFQLDNGIVNNDNGIYNLMPSRVGEARLKLFDVSNTDTLAILDTVLNISTFKNYTFPTICNYSKSEVSKSEILSCCCVSASVLNLDFNLNLKVNKFYVQISRNGNVLFLYLNISEAFATEVIDNFKILESGDEIIIEEIEVENPDVQKTKMVLEPVRIKIL